MQIKSFVFTFLCLAMPMASLEAAAGAHAVQEGRLLNMAQLWRKESAVLRHKAERDREFFDIKTMVVDGTLTDREADAMRAEKEKKFQEVVSSLKWSHGYNTALGAIEEGLTPHNNKIERMLSGAGAITSLATLNEKNIGKWRKTRMVLLLTELLLGAWRAGLYGRDRIGSQAKVEKILRLTAAGQRLARLLHHYLVAGNSGKRVRLSYLLQAASVLAPFFGKNHLDVTAVHGVVPAVHAPAAPVVQPVVRAPAAVRLRNRAELWKGVTECPVCMESFHDIVKGFSSKHEGVDKTLRSTVCGHVFCHKCIRLQVVNEKTREKLARCAECKCSFSHRNLR